ncbi:MAG: hypothetical protein ACYC35_24835 [Pirellulales bacterium]
MANNTGNFRFYPCLTQVGHDLAHVGLDGHDGRPARQTARGARGRASRRSLRAIERRAQRPNLAPLQTVPHGGQLAVQFGVLAAQGGAGICYQLPETVAIVTGSLHLGQQRSHLVGQARRPAEIDPLLPARHAIDDAVIRAKPPLAAPAPRGDDASLPGEQGAAGEDVVADGLEAVHGRS